MKKILAFTGAFFLFAAPGFCQDIAPPKWIQGTWYMEYQGELLELIFLEDDILMNGESMKEMAEAGYIVDYQQALDGEAYSIRVEYADGFWWVERFPRPSMTSAYADKAGREEGLFYLRGEGLSPKNAPPQE
ncbi:MAG: hypothetical protein LBE02_05500 [Spirochaetaceae bacterium]|jgi:hypothetical protein|nr:hypothetical protein [Spirochaetaceae bacterium]